MHMPYGSLFPSQIVMQCVIHFDWFYRPSSPTTAPSGFPQVEKDVIETSTSHIDHNNDPRKFDSTGMFHWTPERPMKEHLIVGVFPSSIFSFVLIFILSLAPRSLNTLIYGASYPGRPRTGLHFASKSNFDLIVLATIVILATVLFGAICILADIVVA
jgi:hypothetical protein